MDTENEVKKNVYVGETGNKAEVTEETRNAQSLDAQYARSLVAQAGKMFTPLGSIYLGSACVHYYESAPTMMNRQYFTACQTDVSVVEEQHADLGWKNLKSALMKAFGRKEPKTRGNA